MHTSHALTHAHTQTSGWGGWGGICQAPRKYPVDTSPGRGFRSRAGAPQGRVGDCVPPRSARDSPQPPQVSACTSCPRSLPGLGPRCPRQVRGGAGHTVVCSLQAFRSAPAPLTCPTGAVGRFLAARLQPPRRRSTVARTSRRDWSALAAARAARGAPFRLRKSEPGAEVGLVGQKLVRGSRGWRGASVCGGNGSSLAPTGVRGGWECERSGRASPRGSVAAELHAPCSAGSDWNRVSPADPQPPQPRCHGNALAALPPPAPPERLKRQPLRHRGREALLGIPHALRPPRPLLFTQPRRGLGAGDRKGSWDAK